MDDLLSEFLTETNESLSELDGDIVRLEQNPNDQELLGNIFRLVHTIKGTCGFLGLPRLESVAHAGENVLGRVRDGELAVNTGVVTIILECLDRIREILDALEQTEQEPNGDDSSLIARLNVVAEGGAEEEIVLDDDLESVGAVTVDELEAAFLAAKGPEELEAERQAAEETMEEGNATPEVVVPVAAVEPALSQKAPQGDGETRKDSIANQSIRVNVEVLEDLMTMVSELVLTRNQLLQISRSQKESEFGAPLQRLNHVVSELQEGVMATRMQPIGNAWAKLPRIIRDLSQELGKRIELVMRGAETELDRQVLELIKDPLTHMVRNSADHGLEIPEERIKTGKPEQGTVTLNAYHEGGHIIIEISDDGRGLAVEKIKTKILANGLASEGELESLSEQQIQQYIFKAGFSTAEAVTSVSGRGVGMDVVRTNIEKIGGTIELTSIEGKGSKFTIKIPLTLAIVSALIVECAGERFAIPQLSVVELVRASANSEYCIEHINETPVLRLRNRLLPLASLRELLRLDDRPPAMVDPQELHDEEDQHEQTLERKGEDFIVVAKIGTYSMGIIVDRVFDTEEIVVKPVAPILRDQQLFSGNTILGDGSVVMILDPNGIASATGELSVADDDTTDVEKRSAEDGELTSMLVFRAVDEAPKAVPLNLIARLEEIDIAKIERSHGQHMVQYRGQLMPLVCMEEEKDLGGEGRQPVLVFTDGERTMGLVVDEIVDIVEDRLKIELTSDKDACMGTAIIDGKATDIIDASYYLTQAYPDWFEGSGQEQRTAQETRLLLIDDSPFFRNLLQPLLSISGYEVVCVESADKALELCEAGENFDVIISDIEMPGMNGFDFAEKVKEDTNWRSTPLVALSSYANPRDLERGRKAGFSDYVSKTDRDALLQTLMDAVSQSRGAA